MIEASWFAALRFVVGSALWAPEGFTKALNRSEIELPPRAPPPYCSRRLTLSDQPLTGSMARCAPARRGLPLV